MVSVEDLEKKYFKLIENIILSEDFLKDLKTIDLFIRNNYQLLSEHWQVKNKLKIAVERLLRYYFYTVLNPLAVYNSVLSSDIAFYTEDVLLNIDAKTTDFSSSANERDFYYPAIVAKNQITFKNVNLIEEKSASAWNGIPFKTLLAPISEHPIKKINVPTLSFFIKFGYFDDGRSFRIEKYGLTCIPHRDLSSRFNNDIIINFKSYTYDKKEDPKEEKELVSNNWVEVKLKRKNYYVNPKTLEAWGYDKTKWRIVLSDNTARIKKEEHFPDDSTETIVRRLDSNGNNWVGYKLYE